MTDEKKRSLGLWLIILGAAVAVGGAFLAIRSLFDLSVPAMFDSMLEQSSRSLGIASAVILAGPGIIIGLIGYALYQHFDEKI